MSERIKLANAGESRAMHVKTVTFEKIENTGYNKFDDGSVELLVPAASVERQLDRVGVKAAVELAGKDVRFSRSTELSKYGKPFWNLDPATPADFKEPEKAKRLTGPDAKAPHAAGDLPGDPASAYAEPPEAPPASEDGDPRKKARAASYAAYKALWRDCAAFQRDVCQPAEGGDLERIPFDAASIQAMAATVSIQWDKLGLAVR